MKELKFTMDYNYQGNKHRIDVSYQSTRKQSPTHGEYSFRILDPITGLKNKFVALVDHLPSSGDFIIETEFIEKEAIYKEIVELAERSWSGIG